MIAGRNRQRSPHAQGPPGPGVAANDGGGMGEGGGGNGAVERTKLLDSGSTSLARAGRGGEGEGGSGAQRGGGPVDPGSAVGWLDMALLFGGSRAHRSVERMVRLTSATYRAAAARTHVSGSGRAGQGGCGSCDHSDEEEISGKGASCVTVGPRPGPGHIAGPVALFHLVAPSPSVWVLSSAPSRSRARF